VKLVITGIGPVTAAGVGKEALWDGIIKYRQNVSVIKQTVGAQTWGEFALAEVGPISKKYGVSEQTLQALTGQENNRDLYLFATAAQMALRDANLGQSNSHCGITVAHENPGNDAYTSKIWSSLSEAPILSGQHPLDTITTKYESVRHAGYNTHSFVLLQQLTSILDIHGPAQIINNACASGLFALEAAACWIRSGHADAMVIVSGDSPRLITRHLWLKEAKACTTEGVMRPFDLHRCGFILGEGAGAVVLESETLANNRGAKAYCEYIGGAFTSDGWKLSVPCVKPSYYERAVKMVLDQNSLDPAEIDLIVPHGAASPIHDRYEAAAIRAVFGHLTTPPLVTALKPYVGHTLAGSALIETIISILAASYGVVPATLNLSMPDPALGIEVVTIHHRRNICTWMKTSTGFGGFNAACVFRQLDHIL
jgi:3-oxoacyl-(acyl-carrier-protein) synthase